MNTLTFWISRLMTGKSLNIGLSNLNCPHLGRNYYKSGHDLILFVFNLRFLVSARKADSQVVSVYWGTTAAFSPQCVNGRRRRRRRIQNVDVSVWGAGGGFLSVVNVVIQGRWHYSVLGFKHGTVGEETGCLTFYTGRSSLKAVKGSLCGGGCCLWYITVETAAVMIFSIASFKF